MVLIENKFYRPEQNLITINGDSAPDENGNVNCYYCVDCHNCKNCIGSINCSNCFDCTNCKNCRDCSNCYDSSDCSDCNQCIDCISCNNCFGCDGVIAKSNHGTYCTIFNGLENSILSPIVLFPNIGSTLYHDKIEAFLLINHFVPYKRPTLNASNYNCHINWRVTLSTRRYWITEEPKRVFYSFMEIAMFVFMNKLQYENWELITYIKECYEIPLDNGINNIQAFIDKLLIPRCSNSQTVYDEIQTKNPNDCLYSNVLLIK